MKKGMQALIVSVVAFTAVLAIADIKVVNDSITTLNGQEQAKGEQTSYYRDNMTRMEAPDGTITIFRLDKGLIWSIDPKRKVYTEQTVKDLANQFKQAPPELLKIEKDTKITEETKKIGNYNCTKIITTLKMMGTTTTITTWATKDIKMDKTWNKFSENLSEAFKEIPTMQVMSGIFKDLSDEGFFPVETVNEASMFGMKTVNKTTLKSVSTDKLDDKLFELPEGLTKQTMPTFGDDDDFEDADDDDLM